MSIYFENLGSGSHDWSSNATSGSFTFTHPQAADAHRVVLVGIAGYRTTGTNINLFASYAGVSMVQLGKIYTNDASSGAINHGFIAIFGLMQPSSATNATVGITWTSAQGCQPTIAAASLSYGEVAGINLTNSTVYNDGSNASNDMSTNVTTAVDRRIVQMFGHDNAVGVAISNYSDNSRTLLTGGPNHALIGDAYGYDGDVLITANRANGADWASIAVQLYPYDPQTLQPGVASRTLTGSPPTIRRTTNTIPYITPGGALTLTGGQPRVHAPVLPTAGSLVLTGSAPQVRTTGLGVPGKATLTLTGGQPAARIGFIRQPGAATLTLTGNQPTVRPGTWYRPGAATIAITGNQAWPNPGLTSVFSSATVLSMVGLNYNINDYMPEQLQGVFALPPYTMQHIDYPASLKRTSIDEGVANLDKAIRATSGNIIVIAHSQGAQVASRWMRTYASDGTAPDASRLMFILTGNPLRSTGNGHIIGLTEVGGTIGEPTPLTTKWWIVDVARRYDGWADYPSDNTDQLATKNANAGQASFHTNYSGVDIYDPENTLWSLGNTTFILTKEITPPLLKNWILVGEQGDAVRAAYKRHIEKAYTDRPVTDPEIVVDPSPNAFWTSFLARAGVDYS